MNKLFPEATLDDLDKIFGATTSEVFSNEFGHRYPDLIHIKYSINGLMFEIPKLVRYFRFIPSNKNTVTYDLDLLTVTYIKNSTVSKFLQNYTSNFTNQFINTFGNSFVIDSVYPDKVIDSYLKPTPIVFKFVSVNRYKEFLKLCHEDIQITQLKYIDIAKSKLVNNYYNLTYIYSVDNTKSVEEYYKLYEDTKLLKVINPIKYLPKKGEIIPIDESTDQFSDEFNNLFGFGRPEGDINNVMIYNSSVHRIKLDRCYLPISKYREYRISSLDYIVDFFGKISKILSSYGFELVEYNKLKDAKTSNIVTFKISSHTKEFLTRVKPRIPDHNIIFSGSVINFNLMTPDTDIYEDFKIRYDNIDFIQNIREFSCKDKYGMDWRYDCIWTSKLDGSFEHGYGQTELGTYGYQFPFQATLEYFDVYDFAYPIVKDIEVTYNPDSVFDNKFVDSI